MINLYRWDGGGALSHRLYSSTFFRSTLLLQQRPTMTTAATAAATAAIELILFCFHHCSFFLYDYKIYAFFYLVGVVKISSWIC